LVTAADVGDVPMSSRFRLESCHEDIRAYYDKVRDSGVIALLVAAITRSPSRSWERSAVMNRWG
ncbi:MAG: hypothetical protein ACI8Y4_001571, partial [Candidatus Poriferisodalaceae bacterium]